MSAESFHCDVCQFAKHHPTNFPPNGNKSSKPFDLIHSDVWGPSPIPNISGANGLFHLLMIVLGLLGYSS